MAQTLQNNSRTYSAATNPNSHNHNGNNSNNATNNPRNPNITQKQKTLNRKQRESEQKFREKINALDQIHIRQLIESWHKPPPFEDARMIQIKNKKLCLQIKFFADTDSGSWFDDADEFYKTFIQYTKSFQHMQPFITAGDPYGEASYFRITLTWDGKNGRAAKQTGVPTFEQLFHLTSNWVKNITDISINDNSFRQIFGANFQAIPVKRNFDIHNGYKYIIDNCSVHPKFHRSRDSKDDKTLILIKKRLLAIFPQEHFLMSRCGNYTNSKQYVSNKIQISTTKNLNLDDMNLKCGFAGGQSIEWIKKLTESQTRSMTRAKKTRMNRNTNSNHNNKRKRSLSPDQTQPSIRQSFAKKLCGLGNTEWKNTNPNKNNNRNNRSYINLNSNECNLKSPNKNKRRKLSDDHDTSTIIDLSNEQEHAHTSAHSNNSHTKMSLDDEESDVELIEYPHNDHNHNNNHNNNDTDIQMMDNTNNKISLIDDDHIKLSDIDINDIEIQLIGLAIGKHCDFRKFKDYDIAPKLIINKHTNCIDLYLSSIHGDNVCVSIKTHNIKALYIPTNPELFNTNELRINPSALDKCEEDYGFEVKPDIQVMFMKTTTPLATYQWLSKFYDPNSLKQPGIERISMFMGSEEFNALRTNWWLNKTVFADLTEKVAHIDDDEKDLWIGHICFGRAIKRGWKKYDGQKTNAYVDSLLHGDKQQQEDEDEDDDIKGAETIDIIDDGKDEDDNVSISIDGSINFDEYIENGEILLRPHHSNSLNYAASRSDCPSKTLECYWVFPAQHAHRQCVMHIESKDYAKVTIEDEWLNDTIVDFQLKYTFASWPAAFKEKVYIFTSLFWKKLVKLRSRKASAEEITQVLRWTKHIKKLFEKEYIIIPKCEHQHWELVIICYPGKVLRKYIENQDKAEDQEEMIKDSKTPCIAILDSLLGTRKSSELALIRKWLNNEAANSIKCKDNNNKVFDATSIKGFCCRVPKQPNGHDGGCFLLRNVLQFGKESGFTNTSNRKVFDLGKWYNAKADGVGYRKEIAHTIARLIKEQKAINDKLRLKHENQKKRNNETDSNKSREGK